MESAWRQLNVAFAVTSAPVLESRRLDRGRSTCRLGIHAALMIASQVSQQCTLLFRAIENRERYNEDGTERVVETRWVVARCGNSDTWCEPRAKQALSCGLGSLPAVSKCVTSSARHTRVCHQIRTPRPKLRLNESTCTADSNVVVSKSVLHTLWRELRARLPSSSEPAAPLEISHALSYQFIIAKCVFKLAQRTKHLFLGF